MAVYNPPKKNTELILYISLASQASPGTFQANPTIATGDFKVSKDGGALANLTTLPTVTPASGKLVKITLSATEMNADNVAVVCSDAAGAEWEDLTILIQTATVQLEDLSTSLGTIDDFLDTEIAAIKAKTDNLPTDPADASDIAALLTAIDDFVDTEVAAIKAKTDNLPTDPADASDIAALLNAIDNFVDTEIADIQSRLPAALVSGRMDSSVGAMAADVITSSALASSASGEIADAVWDEPLTEPSGIFAWAGSFRNLFNFLGALIRNKMTQTSSTTTLRNDADNATIATSTVSDDGTTFTRGEFS